MVKNTFARCYMLVAFVVLVDDVIPPVAPIPKKGMVVEKKKELEIPATEDLMKEHGLLNRLLLIYEELIQRITTGQEQSVLDSLKKATSLVQKFIHDYHEKLEETYIFPLLEQQQKEVRLTKTLRKQHTKGREITVDIQKLLAAKPSPTALQDIKKLLIKFITMYRPHEAREDTVLFPKVRSLVSEKAFKELGEKFEETEHTLFGKNGFENVLKKVVALEKELGIYKLEQFTPQLPLSNK